MSEMVLRVAIILLVLVFVAVLIMAVQHFVRERRQRALKAEPIANLASLSGGLRIDASTSEDASNAEVMVPTRVRILAFSSDDSEQCRILQAPVLRRVVEARGNDVVAVINVDAPTNQVLTQRYHVLTVPTTVLLDMAGKAHAVNYGFTNAQSLLKQVDEILAEDGAQEALS